MTTAATAPPRTPLPWEGAVARLTDGAETAIVCHVNPDADALGSALALGLGLHQLGQRPLVTFPEPFTVPASLAFLPGQELLVPPARLPEAPQLLVTVDAGNAGRLGGLADRVTAATTVLVTDHHATNTGFGTINLVDHQAVATAVVVEELLRRLGVRLDAAIATCLYAALAADSGSFRHPGTTPAAHELAGRLLAAGARAVDIGRELFDTHPFGWHQLLAEVLGRARLEPAAADGAGLVWSWVTDADLAGRDLGADQAESYIDVLRSTQEADVAAILKHYGEECFVSLRSRGRVDVGAACLAAGGGGHRQAAGFTVPGGVAEAVALVRTVLATAPRIGG